MPLTRGFIDDEEFDEHYDEHASEFGGITQDEYLSRADEFLGGARRRGVLQCKRYNRDLVRYDPVTDEFGVLTQRGYIRTYFIVNIEKHEYRTNLDYYHAQC